ncbi:VOC family protein [Natrinema gelatinilyticum]|uniref:VOC family protein n=1 Tax=Natrinema gelatinilyticum TaxID=2961571 RepID=UPI0020C21751|nr:VOC family protein [Natrinema gelatinilyticum]
MRATDFNHVSIHADDLETSVTFYEEVFGLDRIPTYDFPVPVQYLRCGDKQLHIFERETPPPEYHHFSFEVDDFEAVYRTAAERDLFDDERANTDAHAFELPDGAVQLYVRDPAGNLIEINWPDISTLSESVLNDVKRREDQVEQSDEGLTATMFLNRDPDD